MTIAEKRDRLGILLQRRLIYRSGFGGLLSNGIIVDRRKFPNSTPIVEYALFGIPKSKKISGKSSPI
jgi:hypothetical protein